MDSALAQISRGGSALPALADIGLTVGLSFAPAVNAALGRLSERKHERDIAHLGDAIAALANVVASAWDDILARLDTEPRFIDFVDRVVTETLQAEQREKVDYYARLLKSSAVRGGPDEDERVRLLDALDAMRPHHLRLFHTIATTELVPREVEALGSVWETMHRLADIDLATAQRDIALLERLQLVDEGWPSTAYLRARLSEFGLRFEAFVTTKEPRARPRWSVAIEGDHEHVGDVVRGFGRPDVDPRVVRERGGFYLVSAEFDVLDDASAVRHRAEDFLDTAQTISRVSGNSGGRPRVARVVEWREGAEVVHEITHDQGATGADRWPAWPLEPIVARLMKSEAAVERALDLTKDGSWEALAECVNLVEQDFGGRLTGFPEVSDEELERFDAVAVNKGLNRPKPGRPGGAMIDTQAAALTRNIVRAWLYWKEGLWRAP